jgi:hypothetical protein
VEGTASNYSLAVDKERSSCLGFGLGLTIPCRKKQHVTVSVAQGLGPGLILWVHDRNK